MLGTICSLIMLAGGAGVPIPSGVSPDGNYEVVLEADHDSAGFIEYEFKGSDEEFPAFLVLERSGGVVLGRFAWPGDASDKVALLRNRSEARWRADSTAVAINTRDMYYADSLILTVDPAARSATQVPVPPYHELSGRPDPPPQALLARGRDFAVGWTLTGLLSYETWRWGDVDYPLSYRVSLQLTGGRLKVVDRSPILEGRPSW